MAAGRAEDWNGRAVSRSVTLHDGQRPRSVTAASSCCVPERSRALSACVRVRVWRVRVWRVRVWRVREWRVRVWCVRVWRVRVWCVRVWRVRVRVWCVRESGR